MKKTVFFAGLFVLLMHTAWASGVHTKSDSSGDDSTRTPFPQGQTGRANFLKTPPPPGFEAYDESPGATSKGFRKDAPYFDIDSLAQRGVDTVEAFIEQLPEIFRRRYLLLKNSKSTHKADEKNPRVVMFNYDAKGRSQENHPMEMIAFGTHPDDPAKEVVERIRYNPSTYEFEFSAIDFGSRPPVPLDTNACKDCHSSHLRPNWDPAHNWPNAFGVREKFTPDEKQKITNLMHSHPRMKRFDIKDQLREDEQTPGTIMFYGLFGPTQHYVANKFFQNSRYPMNRTSLLKVLAGCQGEIDSLTTKSPNVLAEVEQVVKKAAPDFKFKDDNNPVLNEASIRHLAALQILFRSSSDKMEWFGKTKKVPQMYSHAFFREDYEMLLGSLCERDPEVRNTLLSLGANAQNPCYNRETSTQRLCDVNSGEPQLWAGNPVAPLAPGAIPYGELSLQACSVPAGDGKNWVRSFCVKASGSSDLSAVWFSEKDGFTYCKDENVDGSCRGERQRMGPHATRQMLDHYVEMEKKFRQLGVGAEKGSFRDAGHRAIAELAFKTLSSTPLSEAVTKGIAVASLKNLPLSPNPVPVGPSPSGVPVFTGSSEVVGCRMPMSVGGRRQEVSSFCAVGANQQLNVILWDEQQGVLVCERFLSDGRCEGRRFGLNEGMVSKLLDHYAGMEKAHRLGDANHRALVGRVVRRLSGGRSLEDLVSGERRPRPRPLATNQPTNLSYPGGAATLAQLRESVATVLRNDCFSCHNGGNTKGGFKLADSPSEITPNFVAALRNRPISPSDTSGETAMDRIAARVADRNNPMPPSGYGETIAQQIGDWARRERNR